MAVERLEDLVGSSTMCVDRTKSGGAITSEIVESDVEVVLTVLLGEEESPNGGTTAARDRRPESRCSLLVKRCPEVPPSGNWKDRDAPAY